MSDEFGELAALLGIDVVRAGADLAIGTMPIAGNTQPAGLLHGGATAALAETLGSIAANIHAASLGKSAAGISLTVHHHRSATPRQGRVRGVARAIHLGKTIADYEIEVFPENLENPENPAEIADGTRIATALLTCALRQEI